ncbi:flagellar motor switch phosphatase FliY [Bacillaceae bacterium Marseille-Q3522]|nr:flagellar motor switch phosphatase FliY [Bacillaceae bacterium Marseille-Q3522]
MMSDGMLSQDEIDALLKGTDDNAGQGENHASGYNVKHYLTTMEQDALGEIGNISFGSSATALSTLLNQKVEITIPTVSVISRDRVKEEFPHPYVAVQVNYTDGFSGTNLLVIKQDDAAVIADIMLGGDGTHPGDSLGDIQLSAVQEAMNQMMGSAATAMSTVFSKRVDISPPSIDLLDLAQGEGEENIPPNDILVKNSFRLKIGNLIDSNIMQLLPLDFAKGLADELLNPEKKAKEGGSVLDQKREPMEQIAPMTDFSQTSDANTGNNKKQEGPHRFGNGFSNEYSNVQPAVFSNFQTPVQQEIEAKNLGMLLDIPLQITVELGRTKRSVKEILELSSGSIIELDKLAGEPVDILVNNRLVAQGEVVVIDENFGVRVTDIISQTDRINKLN